jgi:hypothetical protein
MIPGRVELRQCKYLNNMIEPDHRRIKFRSHPMLGFKTFYNARRVPMGIELMQKIVKGQFRVPAHFGRDISSMWQMVLASWVRLIVAATEPPFRRLRSAKQKYNQANNWTPVLCPMMLITTGSRKLEVSHMLRDMLFHNTSNAPRESVRRLAVGIGSNVRIAATNYQIIQGTK